ncbi:MAG: response regulator [Alphaproteobacteria bacterium]|nr:response regulator [Alphaproteobacteria bacterium]
MDAWNNSSELVLSLVTSGFAAAVAVHQLFAWLARQPVVARRWAFLLCLSVSLWCLVRILMIARGSGDPIAATTLASVQSGVLVFTVLGLLGVAGTLQQTLLAPRLIWLGAATLGAVMLGLLGAAGMDADSVVLRPGANGSRWLMVDPTVPGFVGLACIVVATLVGVTLLLRRQPRDGGLRVLVGVGVAAWGLTLVHDTALAAGLLRSMPIHAYGLILMVLAVSAAVDLAAEGRPNALLKALDRQRAHLEERNALLASALDEAREAHAARKGLLARLSHELRTPLNAVVGMSELALETAVDPAQRRYLEQVQLAGGQLSALVEQALDLRRLETGDHALVPQPLKLRSFLEETVALVAAQATAKGIELVLDAPEDLPPRLVADPIRLRQVLGNLLTNSIQATDQGEVTLWVRATASRRDRVRIAFEVRDTGRGIPAADLARVLDPFEQGADSTGGAGLGLSICRELVQRMGGRLELRSHLSEGTTAAFELDLGLPDADEEITLIDPLGLQGMRVLLGCQSDAAGTLLARELAGWRMQPTVRPVEEVEACLEEALGRREPFGVLLLDLEVEAGPGWALLERIAARPQLAPLIIGLLPLGASPGAFVAVQHKGAAAVLGRPVRLKELHLTLLELAERSLPPFEDPTDPGHDDGGVLRVLVADDHPVNRELLRAILERHDCVVDEAGDGDEALDAIEVARVDRPYDVVFMDVRMPRVDGDVAIRRLREREAAGFGPRTTVVALTAHVVPGAREALLDAGMDAVLAKPLDKQALLELLDRHRPASGTVGPVRVEDQPGPYDVSGAYDASALDDPSTAPSALAMPVTEPTRPPAPPVPTAPVEGAVDVQRLLSLVDGDPDLLRELVAVFLEELPTHEHALIDAFDQGDVAGVSRAAHTLGGSAGNLALMRLHECARSIERAARSGDLPLARLSFPRLRGELAAARLGLSQLVTSLG